MRVIRLTVVFTVEAPDGVNKDRFCLWLDLEKSRLIDMRHPGALLNGRFIEYETVNVEEI